MFPWMITRLPQRVTWSAALTLPVAAIEMSRHLAGWPDWHASSLNTWQFAMAILSTAVVFIPGWPLLAKGIQSYARWKLNMFSLIAPGILITLGFSYLALLLPGLIPDSLRVHGHPPLYFEAAAMITTLVLTGRWIEARAEKHTGDALEALARLSPPRACIIRNGNEEWIPIDDLKPGHRIRLRAGDRVPADGIILDGTVAVDESMLTGEPLPVHRDPGTSLITGTLIIEGSAILESVKTGIHTTLSQIIRMVQQAQESKAPIQRIADRVTGKLVPFVLLFTVLTYIGWWKFGPQPAHWLALVHAVTVLMITCPCALGLATPVAIVAGLGRGAREGILIKNAAALERLASIDTMVLDKTGTLTSGLPALHATIPQQPGDEDTLLQLAASVEQLSHHPLARAITAGARMRNLALLEVTAFHSDTGGGVSGVVNGRTVHAGRAAWLQEKGMTLSEPLEQMALAFEAKGSAVIRVSVDRKIFGLIIVSDTVKQEAADVVQQLKARGIRPVMLTGDRPAAAQQLATALSIEDVHAGVKPDEKRNHIERLRLDGHIIAMAGDGINDAPALAAADVGISMGTGTEVAISSADINVWKGRLPSLVHAIDLSRAVMKNIRQNLFFAFIYNIVMIPVAAGALYPWTGLVLTPMLASAAMSASSISVILNALRLKRMAL